MKNIKYFFLIFLLLQFSCVKDNTVYDVKELNDITIGGFAKNYEIEIGQNLKITPVITTRFNDESSLTYVWYKFNKEQVAADTISYERNLNVEIFDVLPGVETSIMLKVTDSKTGVYTRTGSKFVTKGIYSDGTLIIARNGTEYDLNFLKSKTDVLLENVYSSANDGEKLGEKSKMIIFTNADTRQTEIFKSVIVTCDDNTGGVYLNPVLFTRGDYIRDKFVLPEFPGDIKITAYAADQSTDYLFIDGKMYPRPNAGDGHWYPEIIVRADPTDYSLSNGFAQPFDYPLFGHPVVYDNLHNRFMINTNGGYFSFLSPVSGGKFDPSNLGEGMEMVISGSSNGSYEDYWALMKNTITGEYVMITYMFVYANWAYEFVTKSKTILSRSNYPNLYNGTQLTPGTSVLVTNAPPFEAYLKGISDFFFFLNDNKVFAFNVGNLSEVKLIDGSTYNYTITGIDCQHMPEPTDQNPDAFYVRLGIAVRDNALTTKSAGVAFFRLSSLAGLSATKYYAKTGICDEIISFKEKLD